jgi:hypothetical protein
MASYTISIEGQGCELTIGRLDNEQISILQNYDPNEIVDIIHNFDVFPYEYTGIDDIYHNFSASFFTFPWISVEDLKMQNLTKKTDEKILGMTKVNLIGLSSL